jgi:hypothetical protein
MSTAVATPVKVRETNSTRRPETSAAPKTRPAGQRPSFLATLLRTLSAFAA